MVTLLSFLYWVTDWQYCNCPLSAISQCYLLLLLSKCERILWPCFHLQLYSRDWSLWASLLSKSKIWWNFLSCPLFSNLGEYIAESSLRDPPDSCPNPKESLVYIEHRRWGKEKQEKKLLNSIIYTQDPGLLKIKCQKFNNFFVVYILLCHPFLEQSNIICFCLSGEEGSWITRSWNRKHTD